MKAYLMIIVLVILIAAAGAVYLLQNKTAESKGGLQVNDNQNNEQEASNTQQTALQAHNIKISEFSFNSQELKIKKGDTVVWTNEDSARHTVTSDSGSELDSELFGKSETYSHTFSEAGTFSYHCSPHPGMKARIIVE